MPHGAEPITADRKCHLKTIARVSVSRPGRHADRRLVLQRRLGDVPARLGDFCAALAPALALGLPSRSAS